MTTENSASTVLSRNDIQVMSEFIEAQGLSEDTLTELRHQYPGRHFTWCMDDDMNPAYKPYLEREGFNVYLVDSRDHCSNITLDESVASGLVFAELFED